MVVPRKRSRHEAVAFVVFNTMVVFVLLNTVLWITYAIEERWDGPLRQRMKDMRKVHPGWNDEEIERLFNETWSRLFSSEPYTQFKESPFAGRYVNVSTHGYRAMRRYSEDSALGDHFLWGAEIQMEIDEPPYVDAVHYDAKLSRLLAKSIAGRVPKRAF